MARSTNLVIPEVTRAEGMRVLAENLDLFNSASLGCINIEYDAGFLEANGGDHIEPIRFAIPGSDADQHVDEATPGGSLTYETLAHAKGASVIQSRVCPLEYTRDELKRGKFSTSDYSVAIGKTMADRKLWSLRDNLLAMGVAAIDSMDTTDGSTASANIHTLDDSQGKVSGGSHKLTYKRLNRLLNKMGDAREKIKVFVMHSANMADLLADGMSNYVIDTVAGMAVMEGVPGALGRRLIVVDSSSLYSALTSSYYTEYYVLGLAEGALKAKIVAEDDVVQDTVITTNVKKFQFRQDYDVDFSVQGMKWVTAGTNVNPTNAELATAARWDEYYSDHREAGLCKLVINAS